MDSPDVNILSSTMLRLGRRDQPIRILLVDDQNFVLELFRSYLEQESDLTVVGIANNGEAALDLMSSTQPSVALVDIEMPGMNGLTLTQKIAHHFEQTKVIVLSSHDEESYIRSALEAGAQGYFLKNTPAQELIHAIRFVHRGYLQLGPGLFEKLEGSTLLATHNASLVPATANELIKSENELGLTPSTSGRAELVAGIDDMWATITQEQLDGMPQAWTRGLLYFLVTFAAIALPWAVFSEVDETAVARGRLEPIGATIRLDSRSAGAIYAVHVREGQYVQKGQILLELEADVQRTELQQAQAKLSGQANQLNQSQLLKNQILGAIAIQLQQNQAQRFEKEAQVAQAQQSFSSSQISAPLQEAEKLAEVEQAEVALDEARRNLEVVSERYQNSLAEVERYRTLLQQGAIPEIQVVELEQRSNENRSALIRAEGAVRNAEKLLQGQQKTYEKLQQQMRSEQTQSGLRLQEQLGNQDSLTQGGTLALSRNQQQLEELQSQIANTKSEIRQTQKQIQVLNLQLEQRIVRAPEDGVIFQFPFKKAQAFIQTGELVAQIAPRGLPLILKAQATSQESGQMKVGMPVKLKFDAYPFQDYDVVPGRLRWISPDSKMITSDQGQAEVFELEVELDKDYVENADKRINLTPGQNATAEAIVRQRRIIDFLLDPFRQLQKGGLKL
jgi:hemolysin D